MSKFACLLLVFLSALRVSAAEPLMRDLIGLNTHTIQFKTNLYQPVTKYLRNYHPIDWDFGKDTSRPQTFPLAANKVSWDRDVYGPWRKAGYHAHASLMFDNLKTNDWKDMERDAEVYGRELAKALGPSSTKLIEAAEVGNEPGLYDDVTYRKLFEAMAKGLRAGDPKLRIATCNVEAGKSGRYHKSIECVRGLESFYDIINVHSYAELKPWPTWERSYPEDERLKYLKTIQEVIDWRNKNAPGKEIWLTEFGYDSSTKKPEPTGDFAKWMGVTDTQQAQWIVRSFLIFASMDIDRAYLYWFNDEDKPSVHASAGLTRHYQPKPSFHAVAWLMKSLGDYRYVKTHQQNASAWAMEFVHETDAKRKVLAVWKPTGEKGTYRLKITPDRMERMPLTANAPEVKSHSGKEISVDESPVFVWFKEP
ncbi:MAG: hypothetical protein K0Q55_3175 [Verrucomicrobia bacterium]|jgi:hypothetical protein|nr:hypothetical protein [Verrucomicrobiota bacterium]